MVLVVEALEVDALQEEEGTLMLEVEDVAVDHRIIQKHMLMMNTGRDSNSSTQGHKTWSMTETGLCVIMPCSILPIYKQALQDHPFILVTLNSSQ